MEDKLAVKTIAETVTYELPVTTYNKLDIDLAHVLAIAEQEGVKPSALRIETSASHGLLIRWSRPAEERYALTPAGEKLLETRS